SAGGWGTAPAVRRGVAGWPGWCLGAPAGRAFDRPRPCRNEYRRSTAPVLPASRQPCRRAARVRSVPVRWEGRGSSLSCRWPFSSPIGSNPFGRSLRKACRAEFIRPAVVCQAEQVRPYGFGVSFAGALEGTTFPVGPNLFGQRLCQAEQVRPYGRHLRGLGVPSLRGRGLRFGPVSFSTAMAAFRSG